MNNKPVLRLAFAALAGAVVLAAGNAGPARGAVAIAQATMAPSPAPAATMAPNPMPAPAVTPAGNPSPSAPAPGTDMLNNNPNGSNWLDKFNRIPAPQPRMAMPRMRMPGMTMPMHHRMPPACRAMMKNMKRPITPAQHAMLKARCMRLMHRTH